jgi:hypothetical protein
MGQANRIGLDTTRLSTINRHAAAHAGATWSAATWRPHEGAEMAHQQYVKNHNLGKPQQYADTYSGGKPFLTEDGHLVPNATAGQKQAYNEWLKDPAVANALDKSFLNRNDARIGATVGAH